MQSVLETEMRYLEWKLRKLCLRMKRLSRQTSRKQVMRKVELEVVFLMDMKHMA